MASSATLQDTLNESPANPERFGIVTKTWYVTFGTAANTMVFTSAVSGFKSITKIQCTGKNTAQTSCASVQTYAGGAFTILYTSAKNAWVTVTGSVI